MARRKPLLRSSKWLLIWCCLLGLSIYFLVLAGCASSIPTTTPISPIVTQTAWAESRSVEMEWPSQIWLGESDIVRLSLVPTQDGYAVSSEFPNHQVETKNIQVARTEGLDLYGVARLDGVGFDLAPDEPQELLLPATDEVSWRWSVSPRSPGMQRLSVSLVFRWRPVGQIDQMVREVPVYARGLDVTVRSFFGLPRGQAMTIGLVALLVVVVAVSGATLSRTRMRKYAPRLGPINSYLSIDLAPEIQLSKIESDLFRAAFPDYAEIRIEKEYLSGYSGARSFLVVPLKSDGRVDAASMIKMSSRSSIQKEYQNYESFVKNTLPPVTARIQQQPVSVTRPLSHVRNDKPRKENLAAIRYTFLSETGRPPISLRQALLEHSDPRYLEQLFDTFGPGWWMQRRPYTFRLAQEYDRLLPSHLFLEATEGKGKVLSGSESPANLNIRAGDLLRLKGFSRVEPRPDGTSMTLYGKAAPGQAPLRICWLGTENPQKTTGRVIATRQTILPQFVAGFERGDLPDPLGSLLPMLYSTVRGTQSILHGDLNLENLLIGPGGILWLIDFAETRQGHTLFDFAHLEAQIIAHVLSPMIPSRQDFLAVLEGRPSNDCSDLAALLTTLHTIAGRCLFNPSRPQEYDLALAFACLGALKFQNLDEHARYFLYLTAAYLAKNINE